MHTDNIPVELHHQQTLNMLPSNSSSSKGANIIQLPEETPVVLPLPPRREDEPDTDPLAMTTPAAEKLPIISHVTSLRQPQKPEPKPTIPRIESVCSINSVRPKITVKTAAQLSASVPPPVRQQLPTPVRPSVRQRLTTPARPIVRQRLSTPVRHQLLQPMSSPVRQQLPAPRLNLHPVGQQQMLQIISPIENPQPVEIQIVMNPNSAQPHLILTPTSKPSQFSVTQNAQGEPVLITQQVQGQSIFFPDRQFVLTPTIAPSAIVTQPQNNVLVTTNASTLRSNDIPTTLAAKPVVPQPLVQNKTPTNPQPQIQILNSTAPQVPLQNPPAPSACYQIAETSAEAAQFTEKLARQAIAAVKEDITKAQQKSRAVQKKLDLLKLKVTTYEAFVEKLVKKNIISSKSARLCRVLPEDVAKYKMRRQLRGKSNQQEDRNKNGNREDTSKQNKEPVGTRDTSTAIDHDYL